MTEFIPIELDGKKFELRPSSEAARFLSSKGSDGLEGLAHQCDQLNFKAIQSVVEAGLGDTAKELPDMIYRAGLVNVAPICIEYIKCLSNSGNTMDENNVKQ